MDLEKKNSSQGGFESRKGRMSDSKGVRKQERKSFFVGELSTFKNEIFKGTREFESPSVFSNVVLFLHLLCSEVREHTHTHCILSFHFLLFQVMFVSSCETLETRRNPEQRKNPTSPQKSSRDVWPSNAPKARRYFRGANHRVAVVCLVVLFLLSYVSAGFSFPLSCPLPPTAHYSVYAKCIVENTKEIFAGALIHGVEKIVDSQFEQFRDKVKADGGLYFLEKAWIEENKQLMLEVFTALVVNDSQNANILVDFIRSTVLLLEEWLLLKQKGRWFLKNVQDDHDHTVKYLISHTVEKELFALRTRDYSFLLLKAPPQYLHLRFMESERFLHLIHYISLGMADDKEGFSHSFFRLLPLDISGDERNTINTAVAFYEWGGGEDRDFVEEAREIAEKRKGWFCLHPIFHLFSEFPP